MIDAGRVRCLDLNSKKTRSRLAGVEQLMMDRRYVELMQPYSSTCGGDHM